MLEIYMVRHGQTLFNQKDMVQGWCDSPLSSIGKAQASSLGKNMQKIPFTLAFSSPSERASDTAEAILNNRLPVKLDKRLKEINFGYLEGDKNAALRVGKPEDYIELIEVGWVDEGGENRAMVLERIASFFETLTSKYDDEVVLLSSHGMWIDMAIQYMTSDYNHSYALENCSVTKVTFENGVYHIHKIGDISYRDKEEAQ